jgi:hypothetical protein
MKGLLLIIGGIWLLIVVFAKLTDRRPTNRRNPSTYTPSSTPSKKQNDQTFRPSSRADTKSNISFKTTTSTSSASHIPAAADLEGLHDAFTGAPLDKSLGLHQCQSCKVYYHTESLQVLREANNSQCVACQSTNIIAVVAGGKTQGGKDYTPNVVTLQNYKQHEGSVVTFEGRVHTVNESRRGNDFAVMFEDKSWVKGFKLVFFRGAVRKVGASYINSLAGKTIKVRGLVVKHPRFGYEIIVSEKSMILSVK